MVYIKSWCYYSPKPEIDSRTGKPALHGDFLNAQSCQEWDSTHQPVSGKWMDKHPTMQCVLLHLQSIPRLCGKTSIASAKYESTFQQHYRAPLLDPWGMLQAVKLIVLLITSGTVECKKKWLCLTKRGMSKAKARQYMSTAQMQTSKLYVKKSHRSWNFLQAS